MPKIMLRVNIKTSGRPTNTVGPGKRAISAKVFNAAIEIAMADPRSRKATTIIISQNLKYTPGRITDGTLIGSKAIVRAAKVIVNEICLVFI
jgi:hypothetical protein